MTKGIDNPDARRARRGRRSGRAFAGWRGHAARSLAPALLAVILLLALPAPAPAQGGGHMLFGDVKVDESKVEGPKPLSFDIILYSEGGTMLGRQTATNNGRYRFLNLPNGRYDLAVEVEGAEVARVRVMVQSGFKTDHRQDLHLEWRADARAGGGKPQTVSAADFYKRTAANQSLFEKARKAIDGRRYDQAASLLGRLVASDPKDFQAWTELGTVHLLRDDAGEAETAYRRAAAERPAFALALLNLGRLLMAQKKFEGAVEPLTKALGAQPASAEANLLLGEAYLQLRQGSKAVPRLNEAARLGRPEAHLRLATLYNAAGLKEKAAAEYEQFLAKRPDHPDRKKLAQYVAEHKKR